MNLRSHIVTNSKSQGWCIEYAVRDIQKTRCFLHIPEQVIFGFLMFHAYGDMVQKKDKFVKAHSVTKECHKCKGRGWFGRGRKPCPECNGEKEITTFYKDKWHLADRRKWLLINRINISAHFHFKKTDFVDKLFLNEVSLISYRAIKKKKMVYPKWVDEIEIGEHREISSKNARDKIREALEHYVYCPSIHDPVINESLYMSRVESEPLIDIGWACQRLARKFGMTCPITEQYIPIEELTEYMFDLDERRWPDYSIPGNLGMPKPGGAWLSDYEHRKHVVAATPELLQKLRKAVRKWQKEFDSFPPDEWLLAELLGQAIPKLKRAA